MGRNSVLEVCKVCGRQAKKINYSSRAKGRTYRYYKFVHQNGVTHYFRISDDLISQNAHLIKPSTSYLGLLEDILNKSVPGKGLTFSEIKSALDERYGRLVSTATVYRNINKMPKLDLIIKQEDGNKILYSKKTQSNSTEGTIIVSMSIGFDFTEGTVFVTQFIHINNLGLQLINNFPVSLPVGVIDSPGQISLIAFDSIRKIPLKKECITYSYADQTGILITLNKALRKSEEETIFLHYSLNSEERPINIFVPSDFKSIKVNCEIDKGKDILIKKKLGDGLKEIEPVLVRRTGTDLGHVIVEAEFENTFRGDTLVIAHGKSM